MFRLLAILFVIKNKEWNEKSKASRLRSGWKGQNSTLIKNCIPAIGVCENSTRNHGISAKYFFFTVDSSICTKIHVNCVSLKTNWAKGSFSGNFIQHVWLGGGFVAGGNAS